MFSVVIGSKKTVRETTSEYVARVTFGDYVYMSRRGHGQVARKRVRLFGDGELLDEYCPRTSMELCRR